MNIVTAVRRCLACSATSMLVASASPVSADVVHGVTQRCPTASLGALSHTGPWCQPVACKVDDECADFAERDRSDASVKAPKEPMACVEYPLCVKTENVVQRGGWGGGKTVHKEIAVGACDAAGSCASGATCSREKRCVPSRLASGGGPAPTGAQPAPSATSEPTAPVQPTSAPAPSAGPGEGVPPASTCGRCAAGNEPGGAATLAAWALALAVVGARRARRPRR